MKLNLELTNYCNFNCDYCSARISKRKKQFMDYRLAKRIIHEAAREKFFDSISFTSLGEPLLHPQAIEIIREAKRIGYITFLATNGSLLNRELILKLIKIKLDFLVLGINASCRQEFQLRHSNLNFENYLSIIKIAVKKFMNYQNIKLILSYITTQGLMVPHRLEMLSVDRQKRRIIRFWKRYLQQINKTEYSKKVENNKFVTTYQLPLDFEGEIYRIFSNVYIRFKCLEINIVPLFKKEILSTNINFMTFCPSIEREFTILSNGECTFCCQNDFDARLKLGNIRNKTIKEVLYGKKSLILKNLNSKKHLGANFCQLCQSKKYLYKGQS